MKFQAMQVSEAILLLLCIQVAAQTINGIPDCGKECALNYISSHPNCPLNTQPCICDYLSYYSSCAAAKCNNTEITAAMQPPIPYYIPEVTISIAASATETNTCALSMTLNTPSFAPTGTGVPASARSTITGTRTSTSTVTERTTGPSTASQTAPAMVTGSANVNAPNLRGLGLYTGFGAWVVCLFGL